MDVILEIFRQVACGEPGTIQLDNVGYINILEIYNHQQWDSMGVLQYMECIWADMGCASVFMGMQLGI